MVTKISRTFDISEHNWYKFIPISSKFSAYLPNGFITHLLEVRLTMLPSVAERAARFQPDFLLDYLAGTQNLTEDAKAFSNFNWKLQMLMARNSQNPVFSLILNDFAQIFANMAMHYFDLSTAHRASRAFYHELARTIAKRTNAVEDIVKRAMEESLSIWKEVTPG